MKSRIPLFAIFLFALSCVEIAHAQGLPFNARLLPANPTSADNLKLTIGRACGLLVPYVANSYRVIMVQNEIRVARGELIGGIVPSACTGEVLTIDEIDLGKLPAGNYTLTVTNAPGGDPNVGTFTNAPFTVTDARATKAAPYVRLDYSGQWWDPADSGWGLFIWQDAKSPTDNLLVAWFTYTPDGKPMWYVTQPGWTSATATATAQLLQFSRLPGLTSPPPTAGSFVSVGTANLDFTNAGTADVGKITYTFTGGATLTRNIQRFRP